MSPEKGPAGERGRRGIGDEGPGDRQHGDHRDALGAQNAAQHHAGPRGRLRAVGKSPHGGKRDAAVVGTEGDQAGDQADLDQHRPAEGGVEQVAEASRWTIAWTVPEASSAPTETSATVERAERTDESECGRPAQADG